MPMHVFDFALHPYCSNIVFNTQPLLVSRSAGTDQYRLAAADVDYMQLIVDGVIVATIPNYVREEQLVPTGCEPSIYSVQVPVPPPMPMYYGAQLRVVFWRPPVSPFWLSYKIIS
jgi:hypothetical protein